jgi:hypothetical protein
MRATFIVLCEGAGRTHHGSPILIGLFRGMLVPGFPSPLPPTFVAMEVECEPHEVGAHQLTLRMIDEDGRALAEHGLMFDFRTRPTYGPNYAFFAEPLPGPIIAQAPGIYRIDLIWEDQTVGSLAFEVSAPPGPGS